MSPHHSSSPEVFVPVLAWPGRRPSLAELGSWHEALSDALSAILPFDLMACWLLPSRGGNVLIGPAALAADRVELPSAEPLIAVEGTYALEDRIRWAGYQSVMAIPIRAEVQDVGLILIASFAPDAYSFDAQRALQRFGNAMSHSCRRLAAHLWLPQSSESDDPATTRLDLTDRVLEATSQARDGADLVQLASDAIAQQLPHDRFELVAVAPAPVCWSLLGVQRGPADSLSFIDPEAVHRTEAIISRTGSREYSRVADLRAIELAWPAAGDQRSADRLRSMIAVRLEMAGTMVGWLWLGSETTGWFREEDESLARHVAKLLAPSVAAWTARVEQAGAFEERELKNRG